MASPSDPTYVLDIRAFCTVVELQSITAAAKRLHETPGSISRRISRLEKSLDVTLLHRSNRGVTANDDGLNYFNLATKAVELLDEASHRALQSRSEPSGYLTISCAPGYASNIFPAVLQGFIDQYPGVRVELVIQSHLPNFTTENVDVAIIPALHRLRDSNLVARRIDDWNLLLVASPEYLSNAEPIRTIEDIDAHRLIVGGQIAHPVVRISLVARDTKKETKVKLRPALISLELNFVKQCCLNRMGVALLPNTAIRDDLAGGRLVDVLPCHRISSFSGTLYLVHAKMKSLPSKLAFFKDYMLRNAAKR